MLVFREREPLREATAVVPFAFVEETTGSSAMGAHCCFQAAAYQFGHLNFDWSCSFLAQIPGIVRRFPLSMVVRRWVKLFLVSGFDD